MDKLNELTKDVIAWAKERPASAILLVTAIVVSAKVGSAIGNSIGEAIVAKIQS